MGLFSKLFGSKGESAGEAAKAEDAPRFELAAEPEAAARQCFEASDAIAASLEDRRERVFLAARRLNAISARGEPLATVEAMVEAAKIGLETASAEWTLEVIGRTLGTVRDRELRARAAPLVAWFANTIRELQDEDERRDLLPPLALAQAAVGDVEGAYASTAAIDDPYFAAEARASVIELLCELGELEAARGGLIELQEPPSIGRALKAIAAARRKAEQWSEAEEVARSIRTQPWRDSARADAASARARRGDVEGALELTREIQDPESLGAAQVDIAEVLAEKGEHERADELVADIAEIQTRCRGWRELAQIHGRAGDIAAAEARALRVSEPAAFVDAMLVLADLPAAREDVELRERFLRSALAGVKKVQDSQGRYHRILFARILSRAGNVQEALALLDGARPEERADVLDEIGHNLARAGHRAALESALARPLPPTERATLLLAAARALAAKDADD